MSYNGGMKSAAEVCLVCLFLLPCWKAAAQAPSAAASPAASADLGSSLLGLPAAAVGAGNVVLTVSPKTVLPVPAPTPDSVSPTLAPPTLENTADRYGRLETWFSRVCAVAPPAMTVLNTSPALADLPLGSLAGQHPETYLLGSLTPEQLRQAGGPGLAYADMTPGQQSLLQALVPEPLEIIPATAILPERTLPPDEYKEERDHFDAQIQKVSSDALYSQLRFHAYLTADFFVHAPKGYGIGDTRELAEATGAFKLPFSGYSNMENVGKGMEKILRADVPNAPKPGDLAWNRADLSRTVTLRELTTVDDLTARLSKATGLELYADPHYGPQALLAVGDLQAPQAAGDVMQALALCVCGTWRQVGPAYVLTDDVMGLGTRQQLLAEIGQIWSNRLSQAGKDAGAQLQALDWMHSLSFVPGDIGALPPTQIDAIQKENGSNKGNLPWQSLPPALRRHLIQVFSHYGDELAAMVSKSAPSIAAEISKEGDSMKAAAQTVKPYTPVETTLNIRLAVELPGTGAMMLYGDYRVQAPEASPKAAPAKPETEAPAGRLTLSQPLRAVLCAPATPAEAREVVARLPKMGLNTLFLDVFTGGRTFFPNTALPPTSDKAAGVLQAALDAARPLHIPVYAVLDTFCWRKDGLAVHPQPWPAGFAEDLTLSGEAPDRAIQRRVAAGSLSADYDHPRFALASEGTQAWASPLDPAVRSLLPTLAGTLAATPGLAGVVFEDTDPPGYSANAVDYGDRIGLGYTPQSRLAYLRRTHEDPVDLSSDTDMVSVYVGGEFFFGHYSIGIPTFESMPNDYAAWTKYRIGADSSLLTACRQSARNAAPSLPLLRRTGTLGNRFVSWIAADQATGEAARRDIDNRPMDAHSILSVGFGPDDQAHSERFIQGIQSVTGSDDQSKNDQSKAGGIVFDLVTGGPPVSLTDTLDRLDVILKGLTTVKN